MLLAEYKILAKAAAQSTAGEKYGAAAARFFFRPAKDWLFPFVKGSPGSQDMVRTATVTGGFMAVYMAHSGT